MMDETLIPRLIEVLHQRIGQLTANVLELDLRLGDAVRINAQLTEQATNQSERIRSDTELLRIVREERDRFRALAAASLAAKRKHK